ncbi:cob(I)yrinic acid a,c-diamide adenosyltransferase [Bacillus piscicola]|uniref:cob(I)yrinic acid a,c-diamide adenosyltransferase n=1 Tax=Bacillus piscicola TaxID=1632684 RepID=UPI001F08D5FC|nr:cob(I)yrinic acid a,c-diamide adenosyltransferase [Bacillus piscicola]
MPIYTKKGDKGETGLFGGSRIAKDSQKVSCYGTLDEANAALGIAYSLVEKHDIKETIRSIQKKLFALGAELASDDKGKEILDNMINGSDIGYMEGIIDGIEKKLGKLYDFIIPGDTPASASLHFARSITRRAERMIVSYSKEAEVRPVVVQYVNRLSDLLFMLARAEAHFTLVEKIKEKVVEQLDGTRQAPPEVSLDDAYPLAKAAEEKAASVGVPVVVAVVDRGGNTVLLHRMPGSILGSLDIAPNKAYTAAAFNMTTDTLADAVQPGAELYGLPWSNDNKIVPFGGGFPLIRAGHVVGGIGISGGTVEEDMKIAAAALEVFNKGTVPSE